MKGRMARLTKYAALFEKKAKVNKEKDSHGDVSGNREGAETYEKTE